MLATIRPSEMCGIEQHRSFIPRTVNMINRGEHDIHRPPMIDTSFERYPLSTGRIPSSTAPSQQGFTSTHTLVNSSRGHASLDDSPIDPRQTFSSITRPSYDQDRRLPGRDLINSASQAPPKPKSKRKRNGMLAFLSLREPSSAALTQFAAREKVEVRRRSQARPSIEPTVSPRRKPRAVSPQRTDSITTLELETETIPRQARRTLHRPALSMAADANRTSKITIGSLTSRPHSMTMQRASRDWPLSSSPLEATAGLSIPTEPMASPKTPEEPLVSRFSDDSSTDAGFLSDFQDTAIAAYLRSYTNLLATPVKDTLVPADRPISAAAESTITPVAESISTPAAGQITTPTADTIATPGLTPDSQTFWFSDTETEELATPSAVPASNSSNVIYWSPALDNESIQTFSAEASEKEDWPLPSPVAKAMNKFPPPPMPIQSDIPEQSLHRHTFSQATTIAATSPTFITNLSDAKRESTSSTETIAAQPQLDTQCSDTESTAPSEMSVQWSQTPKQRLGLGGRMRKSEVLPWEIEKLPVTSVRYVGEPLTRSKSNRFSSFIGRTRFASN